MMMNSSIKIILYSYKNKGLKKIIENILHTSRLNFSVHIIDQNPINREEMFLGHYNVSYQYVKWDDQSGESFYRNFGINNSKDKYCLIMSDDVMLSDGWDYELISFVGNEDKVVSGTGLRSVKQKDIFGIYSESESLDAFSLSKYIDRNFIFAKTDILKSIRYPTEVKYRGQEELLSIELFRLGIDVFSAPSKTYKDLGVRTLETLYAAFSLEHNYNTFIDLIHEESEEVSDQYLYSTKDFLKFHSIESDKLYKLPFQTNDVGYDPKSLAMLSMDGRRFMGGLNKIE